jgi:membrane glycosyltransferase
MDEVAPTRPGSMLPTRSPLSMRVQPLRPFQSRVAASDRLTAPRLVLLVLTIGMTGVFTYSLYQALSIAPITIVQGLFLIFCTLSFAWVALGFSSALLGFGRAAGLIRARPLESEVPASESPARTALLFPLFNEDAARIAATIQAIADELVACGEAHCFDCFILSDSRDASARKRELRAVRLLNKLLARKMGVFYRARTNNVGKKAGNIADWMECFGGAYESFIILDADSIMSAAIILDLRTRMAAHPRVGLIQTVPRLVGA